jgi:hypothetical protein
MQMRGRSAALPLLLRLPQTQTAGFVVHCGDANADRTADFRRLLVLGDVKQSVDAVGELDEGPEGHDAVDIAVEFVADFV